MTRGEILLFTVVLGLLIATEAFTIDSSLPAMPAIAAGLGTSNAAVQFSLSAFMLGTALGQLVHGPLSDRFGRRPVVLGAAALFTAATLGCAFANDIETLTVLRLTQGFGSSAGHILSRAVVRDRFDREDAARLFSYTMIVLGVAPILAPVLGAHLTLWFGWRSIFVFLTLYGRAVLILNARYLRETLASPDKTALNPVTIMRNYIEIGASRAFWGNLVCSASSFAGLFAFLSGAPSSLITYLGLRADAFGYYFALTMVGHLATLFVGGRVVGRYGVARLLAVGIYFGAAGALAMGVLAWAGVSTVTAIVLPAFVFMSAFALIVPQAIAGALFPFPHIAGAASSMFGFLQLVAGAGAGALVGYFDDGTQMAMTTTICLAGVAGLVGYVVVLPKPRATG